MLSPAARPPVIDSHAQSVRTLAAAMLRTGCWFGGAAAAASVAVAVILVGWTGGYGAVVGAAVGFGSSLFTIGLMRLTAAMPVEALLGAAVGGYAVKIGLLLAVTAPLRAVEQLHPLSLGLSVVAVVVAWAAAEVVAFKRTPIPTIIPAREPA